MRIISGTYGGRTLISPNTRGTRPMTDKVRAALFNILGPIDGLTVLDAYAGSGALGLEALSRGAANVTAVEVGREAIQAIRTNITQLGCDFQYQLQAERVETWLARQPEARFDLIFWMPPYDLLEQELMERVSRLLAPEGLLIAEYPRRITTYELSTLQLADSRSYGDPTLAFYKRD